MRQWPRSRFQAAKLLKDHHQQQQALRERFNVELSVDLLDRPDFHADKQIFALLLRECGSRKNLTEGQRIHRHILNLGCERDLFLGNLLVQMYGNCGCLASAHHAFDSIADRNSVSWHLIMLAYANNRYLDETVALFQQMPEIRKNTYSWNIVVTAFAQKGHLCEARSLFDRTPTKDVVSWNTMLSAYVRAQRSTEAIELFRRLNLEPDRITFVCGFDACAGLMNVVLAQELHRDAISRGFHTNLLVATSLVNMYGKFGNPDAAKRAFDAVPGGDCDVVLQTSMIAAFGENGCLEDARDLFFSARKRDVVCWTSIIVACGLNAQLDEAKKLFESMPARSLVAWNAMISACVQNAEYKQAIALFKAMDFEGVGVDNVSCIGALDACANITALEQGRIIHSTIVEREDLIDDGVVQTALVNLYGKCGHLQEARSLFDSMPRRPVAAWNAMLSSYAQKGHGNRVFDLYRLLNLEGETPDLVTFICIISTCSHAGLLEDGRRHFHSIAADYGGIPSRDHYSCVLDLLGRAGRLGEAEELVESMPFEPHVMEWTAVLGGCELHGDVQRGKRVSGRFLELENPEQLQVVAPYLLLSNLHASAGNYEEDDPAVLRRIMIDAGIRNRGNKALC